MEKNSPLVSILIPCYNGQKFIDRCLTVCVKQSYKNIEIIIIDDGSTDNSLSILKKWQKLDDRVLVYSQKNLGVAETRNNLIKKSKGYYFTFIDIDDTIPIDAIEKLVSKSNNADMDIVVGRTKLIYNKNNKKVMIMPFVPSWRYKNNMTNGHYIKSNICPPWASLIRRDFFLDMKIWFIRGRYFEDFGIMTFLFLNTKKFCVTKAIVYEYYRYIIKYGSNQSSFDNLCYKKIDDIYSQAERLFGLFENNKLFSTKQYKRYINGFLLQLVPANIFLVQNLSSDKTIRYVLGYNLIYLIHRMGREIKFSKTFWKSAAYFLVYLKCGNIIRDIKNNKYSRKSITGSYSLTSNNYNKYSIIDYKYIGDNKINKTKHIIQIEDDDLSKIDKKIFTNMKISLCVKTKNKNDLKKLLLKLNNLNVLPFVTIDSSYGVDFIMWISRYILGINIILNNQTLSNDDIEIIDKLNNLEKKKLIYLICKKGTNINDQIKKIDGVFWK